jgi:NDP-sugar pyrophosphorylase family protein
VLTNCDVLADINYENVLDWHREHEAQLTVLGVRKKVDVPYGVIKLDKEDYVIKIDEKPSFSFIIVSGIYVIEPALIDLIPVGVPCDMDQLMRSCILGGRKVVCYPIENGWFDMGQFEEYKQLLQHFGIISA